MRSRVAPIGGGGALASKAPPAQRPVAAAAAHENDEEAEILDLLLAESLRLVPELRAHLPICAMLLDHEVS